MKHQWAWIEGKNGKGGGWHLVNVVAPTAITRTEEPEGVTCQFCKGR